ncbi:ferredoxin [Streptomyces sp. 7-21]|uniref:ferredoxin n=1 Tax=Streptomyces sp. 7-21 TaxID=2802283 RepID=UPI00191E79F4|nr:ferredoxin [Streptomyces sp. 7-21]MBL1069001.1 ferredoxin [Streptomyces sp. 7-21]
MRLRIDRERCASSGLCADLVPEVFDQDEDEGKVTLLTDTPEPELHPEVRAAAARCPAEAIFLSAAVPDAGGG